jgi:hypothetical protein
MSEENVKLQKIISGAQTGVDRAGCPCHAIMRPQKTMIYSNWNTSKLMKKETIRRPIKKIRPKFFRK